MKLYQITAIQPDDRATVTLWAKNKKDALTKGRKAIRAQHGISRHFGPVTWQVDETEGGLCAQKS